MVKAHAVTSPDPADTATPMDDRGGAAARPGAAPVLGSGWGSTWGSGGLASSAGLLVLAGMALPITWGLAPALAVALVAAGLAARQGSALWRGAAAAGGWSAVLARLGPSQRIAVMAAVGLPVAVLGTVAARAVASIAVAFPAAVWGVLPLVLAAVVLPRARGRARGPVLLALVLAVPLAGIAGARFESAGDEARGWAHSGPILGIHPFQATAVRIDGHGPYDLPLNDYVEPDGSRGYGPAELAAALERALHEIAARHFADGPARARRAFAGARVEARELDAVRESLEREPSSAMQPRIQVWSGTTGQRSRVEFLCPGKQDDPAGVPDEAVMSRMCPNKYISEASAGLGLTGRWPGYTEARGNERLGISRLFGWTRSDDDPGRRVAAREVRWWAWLGLLGAGLVALFAGSERRRAVESATSAIFVVTGVLLLLLVLGAGGALHVALVERAPAWSEPWSPRDWLPALALWGGALGWVAHGAPSPQRATARVPAIAVVVGTLGVAAWVRADAWVRPALGDTAQALALEDFVLAAADAVGERAGLSIEEVEGATAAIVLALLVGALWSWAHTAGATAQRLWPFSAWGRRLGTLGVLAVSAALVVSRKTDGAAALVPAAMATIFVLGSGLSLVASRGAAPATRPFAHGSGHGSGHESGHARWQLGWRGVWHVAWVAFGIVLVWRSLAGLPAHEFVTLCRVVALTTLAGSLSLLAVAAPKDDRDEAPRPP